MPKYKALPTSTPESIEQAWNAHDEIMVTRAVVRKYCRVLDMTDSGRDIRPLASGLFETIDRLKALEATQGINANTPLATILEEANRVLSDAD